MTLSNWRTTARKKHKAISFQNIYLINSNSSETLVHMEKVNIIEIITCCENVKMTSLNLLSVLTYSSEYPL